MEGAEVASHYMRHLVIGRAKHSEWYGLNS